MVKALRFVFILLFYSSLFGQNPNFYTLTKNDGLPSNGVYDIFEDRQGFMWFATQKGLSKFDGNSFTTYTLESQSNVAGSAITEDKYGRIWYCNFDGFLFYVEKNVLKALPQKETNGYFKFGIIEDRLFLIQKNKVLIYDLLTLKILKSIPLKGEKIVSTFVDKDSFYVLSDSLLCISPEGKTKSFSLPEKFETQYTAVIIQEGKEGLVIVSKESKRYFEFKEGKFTEYFLPTDLKVIQNVGFVAGNNWLCTTAGIYKMERQRDSAALKRYFPTFNITSVFKDSQNNYWFGTQNKGLLLVPDLNSIIIPLSSRPLKIARYKSDYLISTDQDVLFLFSPADLSVKKMHQGNTQHPINQLTVNADNDDVYFTSSTFNILKPGNSESNKTFIAVKDVNKIDEKFYSYAASGSSGVFKVDNTLKSNWDPYFKRQEQDKARFNETSILQNSNGKCTVYNADNQCIYFGTNEGLYYNNFTGTKELKLKGESLYISSLACYKSSVFALSTNGTLFKISTDQKITLLQLPSTVNKSEILRIKIIEDTLFLITENALWQYDLQNNSAKMLLYGIEGLDLTDLVKSRRGYLLMTSQGILITPDAKPFQNQNKKFIFTETFVNGNQKTFSALKKLKSNEQNIRINFAVLAFVPDHQPEIIYRINKEKWQTLEKNSRSLLLNTLQHGEYTVEFRTKSGTELSQIYQLSFSIEKPFYLRLEFVLLFLLIAGFTIYILFTQRIKKFRRQNELVLEKINLEKNLNLSKLKAIKSQMNPHFFYNALNTIQAYILSNEKKLAVGYLSKFSLLTRKILEMTEKEFVTIADEIKTLTLYLDLEKVRFNNDFNYEIIAPHDAGLLHETIPSMLLQPYVENALKHGLLHKKGEKKLFISFQKRGGNLIITINDNGIGRQKSSELNALRTNKPASFATEATNKRIDLLNISHREKIESYYEDHFDSNGDSAGTTVFLKFPLTDNQTHYESDNY
jgi:sensor histidine kinase YesM/ligand-binding sensor domain-containing protein